MASAQPASEVFGQMKKYDSSSSRNEEWPGARKHRTWLRWSAALTIGLAVAAGVSIPLEEKNTTKINNPSNENAFPSATTDGSPISEEPTLENYTPAPFSKPLPTDASSGAVPRKGDIDTRLNFPSQEPAVESSTVPREAQAAAERENATPAQGSDITNGEGESADIRTSPQQALLGMPQAPAVGRIPPVRLSPTPIPTPPPIRSPQ